MKSFTAVPANVPFLALACVGAFHSAPALADDAADAAARSAHEARLSAEAHAHRYAQARKIAEEKIAEEVIVDDSDVDFDIFLTQRR